MPRTGRAVRLHFLPVLSVDGETASSSWEAKQRAMLLLMLFRSDSVQTGCETVCIHVEFVRRVVKLLNPAVMLDAVRLEI